jgi:hypothetical protein
MTRATCLFGSLALALLVSVNALAEEGPKSQSDTMTQGLEAYEKGQYELAARLLREDLKSNPWPTSAYYAGAALEQLGKLVEAAELYQEAIDLVLPTGTEEYQVMQKRAQEDARRRLAQIRKRIPHLVLQLEGASPEQVTVTVDDAEVPASTLSQPVPLDPGSHQVVGRCGQEVVKLPPVTLAERQRQKLVLRFQCGRPAPSPASKAPAQADKGSSGSTGRTLGWVAVGVGSAGVAFGAVTGAMGLVKLRRLKDEGCDDGGHCYPSQREDVDSYQSLRTWSTVGFYVGVPLIAAGVGILVWASPHQEQGAGSVTAWLGPGSAGLSGRFQ